MSACRRSPESDTICQLFVCVVVTCQGDAEDDEAVPDKESDIKPRFHKAKSHTQKHDPSADGDQVRVQAFCDV